MTTALILSGGGARAAYQVGVLKALGDILPAQSYNPFPIICGTSAGAINTLAMAGRAGPFRKRTIDLEGIWSHLTAEKIYRTDPLGVIRNSVKMLVSLFVSGSGIRRPVALLDNTPLRKLLAGYIGFRHIDEAIASGEMEAVAVTAMAYSTGQSITFFQGNHENWQRTRRLGVRTGLTLDHLMASTAIPTIFPPVKIGTRFYGDGALRQLKPLSPALHLGADRIFVVGVSDNPVRKVIPETAYFSPSVAQMISHMLNSAFIDTIESDLETLTTINRLAGAVSDGSGDRSEVEDLKVIDYLLVTPSMAIDKLAEDYLHELPLSLRTFLRVTGATARGGGSSTASYLLFEPGFCSRLIDLGYSDALAQREGIVNFFAGDNRVETRSDTIS